VIAALSAWHEQHEAAAAALQGVTELPAHVLLECYSVLTRLPGGLVVPAATAASVLGRRFGGKPLALRSADRAALVGRLAAAEVFGGAAYDGLVALEAAAHDRALITLDHRAIVTYRRLGAKFRDLNLA
jgi:hypothetical protein